MIFHQHKTVQTHSEAQHHLSDQCEQVPSICVITEDRFAFISSGGDMIPTADFLDP